MTDENVADHRAQLAVHLRAGHELEPAGPLTAYVVSFYVAHASDPERIRRVLLAPRPPHADVQPDPRAEVEFVEPGPRACAFNCKCGAAPT